MDLLRHVGVGGGVAQGVGDLGDLALGIVGKGLGVAVAVGDGGHPANGNTTTYTYDGLDRATVWEVRLPRWS